MELCTCAIIIVCLCADTTTGYLLTEAQFQNDTSHDTYYACEIEKYRLIYLSNASKRKLKVIIDNK